MILNLYSLVVDNSLFISICNVQETQCISDQVCFNFLVYLGIIIKTRCMIYFQQVRFELFIYQYIKATQYQNK